MMQDGPSASLGRVIAVVGAESTGKTTLSTALADRAIQQWGVSCAVVPEVLRAWCLARGRTPRREEQSAIADAQAQAIHQAQAEASLVIADTTPLMTAVYSQWIFRDEVLVDAALAWQRRHCWATLLLAPDLPWQADPGMRDGPHAQAPVHALLAQHLAVLAHAGGRAAQVEGDGAARSDRAWSRLQAWWLADARGLTAPGLNSGADRSPA